MDNLELLRADLDLQTKRLDLLRTAGGLPELVRCQEEHVAAMEKEIIRLSEIKEAEKAQEE